MASVSILSLPQKIWQFAWSSSSYELREITHKKNRMCHCSVPEEPDEDAKPKSAPVFVCKPEPVTVEEGEWARFQARVTGHPKPRVMWLINGHTVVNVSEF